MDISIEKLNANNYSTWKEDVKVVLMEKGSWRIITEEEKVPDKLSGIKGEEERIYQKLLSIGSKNSAKVLRNIFQRDRNLIKIKAKSFFKNN
ncbi:hypothetical protein AVEN_34553-1 [Araneus ventricosus]|uniref:DUF4219 domain-containing protein n=1 Tax=Araneus ventricosus TaxID=182803 RepID=A0A4Y2B245_ARAVE|nr:hypothetical protein AVEN_34553-1 [Araneus ventricosus]